MTGVRLVLASGSAARRAMLSHAGLTFDVRPADVDEDGLRDSLDGKASHPDIAAALAVLKATTVARVVPDALVIGCDQILSTGPAMLSKPGSREGCRDTLRTLQARTHWLHSGVAIALGGDVVWQLVDTAELSMRALDDDAIERYLDAAGTDIFGCVGAYQIEGAGIRLFERIRGDHFTIMGLPLLPLLAELRRLEGEGP